MARSLHSEDSQSAVSLSDLTARLQEASEAFEKAVDQSIPDSAAGKKAQDEIEALRPEILSAVDSLQIRDPEDTRIQALVSTLYRIDERFYTKWAKRALPALKAFTQSPGRPSVRPFATPKGSSWGHVKIRLISRTEAQITVGEVQDSREYVSLGFEDRRQKKPTRLWGLIQVLAVKEGVLGRDQLSSVEWNKCQKTVQDLRPRLKKLFDIPNDPIPYDKRDRSYRTAFRITATEEATQDITNFRERS